MIEYTTWIECQTETHACCRAAKIEVAALSVVQALQSITHLFK